MKSKLTFLLLLLGYLSGSAQYQLNNSIYSIQIPEGFKQVDGDNAAKHRTFDNDNIFMSLVTGYMDKGEYSAAEHGTIMRGGMRLKGMEVLPGNDSTVSLEIDNTLFFKTAVKVKDEKGIITTNEIYAFDDYQYHVFYFNFIYTDKTPNPAYQIGMTLGSFKMKYVTDSTKFMTFSRPANFQFLYNSLIYTNVPTRLSLNREMKQSIILKCVYVADLEKQAKEEVKSYKKAGWKNVAAFSKDWKGTTYKQIGLASDRDDDYYSFVLLFPKDKYLLRIECIGLHDTFSAAWMLKHVALLLDSARFK